MSQRSPLTLFYRTLVICLATLLTDELAIKPCLAYLIDATLTDEDPYTKVVDFVVEFNSHNSLF